MGLTNKVLAPLFFAGALTCPFSGSAQENKVEESPQRYGVASLSLYKELNEDVAEIYTAFGGGRFNFVVNSFQIGLEFLAGKGDLSGQGYGDADSYMTMLSLESGLRYQSEDFYFMGGFIYTQLRENVKYKGESNTGSLESEGLILGIGTDFGERGIIDLTYRSHTGNIDSSGFALSVGFKLN